MNFDEIKRLRNMDSPFDNHIGVRITDIAEGYARAELPLKPEHYNAIGSVHGGCLFALADSVAGAASLSTGYHATTMDASFYYMRPAIGKTRLIGEARELKRGQRVFLYRVTIRDQDGNLLSEGTFSYMTLGKRLDLQGQEARHETN